MLLYTTLVKKKYKDEASLLGRKCYLLEVESDKARTDGFSLVLLLCCCVASGSSHFSLLIKILIPIFVTSLSGETL